MARTRLPVPSNFPHLTKLHIPDVASYIPFPVRLNRHHKHVCAESDRWFIRGSDFTEKTLAKFCRYRVSFLASRCYPAAAYPQLRVCADTMNWFFYLDIISDEMNESGNQYVASDVMNVLWHPEMYEPETRTAKLCREYVLER